MCFQNHGWNRTPWKVCSSNKVPVPGPLGNRPYRLCPCATSGFNVEVLWGVMLLVSKILDDQIIRNFEVEYRMNRRCERCQEVKC